ncbi:MAG: hypothetical protein ACXWF8_01705 [Methylobacter sp.]
MSYEKLKVLGVREVVKKSTGQVHKFLRVEVLQTYDVYLSETALQQLSEYEQLKGQEALFPVAWGEYRGRPNLALTGDCKPLPIKT